jgi:hypothetical protein
MVDSFFEISQTKKSKEVRSGDLGGYRIVPPLPIQKVNVSFKCYFTALEKYGGASSYWQIMCLLISERMSPSNLVS